MCEVTESGRRQKANRQRREGNRRQLKGNRRRPERHRAVPEGPGFVFRLFATERPLLLIRCPQHALWGCGLCP